MQRLKTFLQLLNANRLVVSATAFVVVAGALILAVEAWHAQEAREQRIEQAHVSSNNLAHSIAQHAAGKIGEADTLLKGLVERLEHDGTDDAALDRLHPLLAVSADELEQLHGIFVYGQYGEWLVNSLPTRRWHFNNADRDYFQYHATQRSREAFIGEPIQSRSTGAWIITVSHRFEHPDGSFAGVALATLNMGHFNDYYNQFNLDDDGSITLGTLDGTLIARHPFDAELIGDRAVGQALFGSLLSQPDEQNLMTSTTNESEFLHAYRQLPRYPLFATVSLSKSELLSSWTRETIARMTSTVLLVMALMLAGYLLIKQLHRRLAAENEIRETRDALQAANQVLERLVGEDGLTGIANRRRLDATLHVEISRCAREGKPLAMILADIDHFKAFNDYYGHPAGDACLREIATLITGSAQHRASDLVARYGGEEFAILLPNTELAGARKVAERIRQAVESARLAHSRSPLGHVTLSFGVHARLPRPGDAPETLLNPADKALYAAKGAGRNRVATSLRVAA